MLHFSMWGVGFNYIDQQAIFAEKKQLQYVRIVKIKIVYSDLIFKAYWRFTGFFSRNCY